MKQITNIFWLGLILVICWICFPTDLQAEFYRYIDDQGRVFYVDDLSKIPERYRQNVDVYKEKYDDLPETQRVRALEKEQRLQQEKEQEHQRQLSEQLREAQRLEEEQRRKKAEKARQALLKQTETRIMLDGNRIIVPVTIGNDGLEAEAHLLLDTGASQIVLHRALAEQLHIMAVKKGMARLAGGQNIYAELGRVDFFKVGPYNQKNTLVLIIAHAGAHIDYDGLLGMNFLKEVEYAIDYKNQVIRWNLSRQKAPGGQ